MDSDVINSNIKLSGQSVGQSQYMDVREASASKTCETCENIEIITIVPQCTMC